MATKVKVNWYPGAQKQILKSCNMITYGIARQTLDLTYSHIPKDTGKMRHPRFFRMRPDKSPLECTWKDHISAGGM